MRGLILFIAIVMFDQISSANYASDFKNLWNESGKIITNSKTKESFDLQTRFIHIGNDFFPVANITNSQTPANRFNAEFKTAENFVEVIKKGFGNLKWNVEVRPDYKVYESADWSRGKFYKLYVQSKNGSLNSSLAVIRLQYLFPTYLETEVLQRRFLGDGSKNVSLHKKLWLLDLIENSAFAQSFNYSQGQLKVLDYLNKMGENFFEVPGQKMDNFSAKMESTFSSKNAAKMGLAMGFTFGLTSTAAGILTNYVVNNILDGGAWLISQALGRFTPAQKEERLALFKEAVQSFGDTSNNLNLLESKMSVYYAALAKATNSPTDNVIADLEKEIATKKRELTEADAACLSCVNKKAKELNQLEAMHSVLSKAGVKTKDDAKNLCKNFNGLYDNWVSFENTLLSARDTMMENFRVMIGNSAKILKNRKQWAEQRQQDEACTDVSEDNLSKLKNLNCSDKTNAFKCEEKEALEGLIALCKKEKEKSTAYEASSQKAEDQAALTRSTLKIATLISESKDKLEEMTKADGSFTGIQAVFTEYFAQVGKTCPDSRFAKDYAGKAKGVDPIALAAALSEKKSILDALLSVKPTEGIAAIYSLTAPK